MVTTEYMNIKEVATILKQIGSTAKKTEKESLLQLYKDNPLLKKTLWFIFNPYVKTNIAKKKIAKKVKATPLTNIKNFDEYMDFLGTCTGKDSEIASVQQYIESQPTEIQWLLEAIAIKDLKIGATATTINKVFGEGFIPQFEIMLAEKYVDIKRTIDKNTGEKKEKIVENWRQYVGKRVIATKKLDGNRALVFVRENGKIDIYSREGHKLEGFVELEEEFKYFPRGQVYDGEILATNEEGLNSKELFKKTSKIIKKKGEKRGLEFHAFDLLPIEAFEKGGFDVPCEKRKWSLRGLVLAHSRGLIKYVEPLYIGEFNKEIIDKLAEEAKANEEEGIMVQLANAGYECKRTKAILKVKSFQSVDVRCVDVYEGLSGKNIGRLGGVIVDYKGNLVRVGGGFSDEERTLFWENKDLILGKIIEITFFEEFEDEDGKLDLRFAHFKCIRDDKTESSYY